MSANLNERRNFIADATFQRRPPAQWPTSGPGASAALFTPGVAIDTGTAGIHDSGTAFRMDDVPLPLRAALHAVAPPLSALTVVRALAERLAGR